MNLLRLMVSGCLLVGLVAFAGCSSGSGSGGTTPEIKQPISPKISNVTPGAGPCTGGTTVEITGEDFYDEITNQAQLEVWFGMNKCDDVLLISSSRIRVVTPEADPGVVDVRVMNDDGSSVTFPQAYTYTNKVYPSLASLDPVTGPNYGNTKVLIKGANFKQGLIVRFGSTPSPQVTWIDSNTLEAVTPYGPAGPVDIYVVNPDNQVAFLANAFAYQDAFRIEGTSFISDLNRITPGSTDHPVNVPIWVEFNRPLDPTSFNENTFSLKTTLGQKATGKFILNGNRITFEPDVKFINGKVIFGFVTGEKYYLSIPGSTQGQTLLAKGSLPLQRGFVWELNTVLDPYDFNQAKPKMSIQLPIIANPAVTRAKLTTDIILEFDEVVMPDDIINPAAVKFEVEVSGYPTRLPLAGTRTAGVDSLTQHSWLKFEPTKALLPSLSKVWITADPTKLHDVVGKTLDTSTAVLYFLTEAGTGYESSLTEPFNDTKFIEWGKSSAGWGGGKLVPGILGGSGILGRLEVKSGKLQLNTNNQVIPATNTLTGKAITITDGVFEFDSIHVAAGATLEVTGTNPIRLLSRGAIEIDGQVLCNGINGSVHSAIAVKVGGTGAAGGPGGAAGGTGGAHPGSGVVNGLAGKDLVVPAGHPAATSAAGTGGKGSPANPAGGVASLVTYNASSVYCQQIAGGGGGGSFYSAGAKGTSHVATAPLSEAGVGGAPGSIFSVLPLATTKVTSLQLPIGGSGGGGGGTHPSGSYTTPTWQSGAGGGGGGGGLQLQAGGDFKIGAAGNLQAVGGNGGFTSGGSGWPAIAAAPGGGGSGGSVLLQVGRMFTMVNGAKISVAGGTGKETKDPYAFINNWSRSGAGGNGFILLEHAPLLPHTSLVGCTPAATAANSALLADSNPVTGAASKWYDTLEVKVTWVRFEIKVKQGTQTVTYSDNATAGTVPQLGTTPIAFYVQGTVLDKVTKLPGTISDWYTSVVALNTLTPKALAARWTILIDTSKLTASQLPIEVQEVKLIYSL